MAKVTMDPSIVNSWGLHAQLEGVPALRGSHRTLSGATGSASAAMIGTRSAGPMHELLHAWSGLTKRLADATEGTGHGLIECAHAVSAADHRSTAMIEATGPAR